jgi:hypothetical protein
MKGKLIKQDDRWYITRLEENEWETFYPLSFDDVDKINTSEEVFQEVEFELEDYWETGLEGVLKMAKITKIY